MNYNVTLKCHLEILTQCQGHDLIGKGYAAYQSIRIVGLSPEHIYCVFIASS